MKIIKSNSKTQESWLKNRDNKLEKAYSKIANGIPLIDIRKKDFYYKNCHRYFDQIMSKNSSFTSPERWNQFEIDRMFGKGLNPTSLKTSLNDIRFFVEQVNTDDNIIKVVEFGPGSGWSTLMLHRELQRKFSDKKIQIISVDISPYSIAATQTSLDYKQIPWQTYLEKFSAEELNTFDSRITLVINDFYKFIKDQPDNYFHGFFSSHGTTYLSKSEYQEFLKILIIKGKSDSIFVTDSLDPLYTVELNILHLLLCSINPQKATKMQEYYFGKSVRSNSKFFIGKEVKKLIKVNNPESMLFYRWNNYLIRHLKIKYLIQMLKSIKTTTDIINDYIEDVFPSYLIKDFDLSTESKKWIELNNLPKTPLYICNAGFKLKDL